MNTAKPSEPQAPPECCTLSQIPPGQFIFLPEVVLEPLTSALASLVQVRSSFPVPSRGTGGFKPDEPRFCPLSTLGCIQ